MLKIKIILIFGVTIIFFLVGCKQIPDNIPANHPVTFTMPQPEKYECFVRHQDFGVPKTKIKLNIHYTTRIITGSTTGDTFIPVADDFISFDPAVDVFPMTFTADAPVSGLWGIVIVIQGTECSECANDFGDPKEASGSCDSYTYTGTPLTYQAAKPQWTGEMGYRDNNSVQIIKAPARTSNVLSTCNENCRIQ